MEKVTIDNSFHNKRIDLVLSLLFPEASRNHIQKVIEKGNVRASGKIVKKNYKVSQGEEIYIDIPAAEELHVKKENIPISIIYEDEDVLIIDKPKGMVVHPAPGNYTGTLVNAIMYHCEGNLSQINGVIRPGIVHRIDKDTSGLLMIAKNDVAHNSLAKQLEEHTIRRGYKALVYNNFKEDEGTINKPIGRNPKNRFKRAVTDKNSKEAITNYTVLERFGKYTLIEARLETGRTHQIRVHMAYINHPLVGDLLYGPNSKEMKVDGQMLHAYILGFKHPRSGQYMEFTSPLPKGFEDVLGKIR